MTAKTQVQPNKSLRCYLRDVYSLQLLKKAEEIQKWRDSRHALLISLFKTSVGSGLFAMMLTLPQKLDASTDDCFSIANEQITN